MYAARLLDFADCRPAHSPCFKNTIFITVLLAVTAPSSLRADIYRWDTGEPIPGTEGIELADGVNLDGMDLEYALISREVWDGPSFVQANHRRSAGPPAVDRIHDNLQ